MNDPARLSLLLLLFGAAMACTPGRPNEPNYPPSGASAYTSGGSVYSAPPSTPAVPYRESVSAGVVVRPDQLCVPFAIHVLDEDGARAVDIAQGVANDLAAKLKVAAGNVGALRMRGIAIAPSGYGKTKDDKPAPFAVVADGAFEVSLDESRDYWSRSKMLASVAAIAKKEIDAHANTSAKVSFEAPRMQVGNAEMHRAKLTKQWVERARAFGDAAQTGGAPLMLLDCSTPGEITQRPISTEEVGLTLTVSCRLDALRPK
jgi:hypothetical protein